MIMPFIEELKISKNQLIWLILSLFLFAVISGYLFANYIYSANPQKTIYPSDMLGHLSFIKAIQSGNLFLIPHPGLHIIVILFSWLSFTSVNVSLIIVLVVCVISSFAITYLCLRSIVLRNHFDSLLISWILFLVCAVYLPFFSKNVYLGQGTPNIWHNPTFIAQKPLAILIFFLTCLILPLTNNPLSKKKVFVISFLLFATVWIKPNFGVTYISFLLIYFFLSSKRKIDKKQYLYASIIVIPSILSLALQYYFTYKPLSNIKSASLVIEYLAVWKHFSPNPYLSFFLGIAFPLMIIIFRFTSIKKINLFLPATIFSLLALTQMALFAEGGVRFYHWNFAWSYNMGLYMLFLVALIEYSSWIRKPQKRSFFETNMLYISSVVLLLHLSSGVFYLVKLLLGFPYD